MADIRMGVDCFRRFFELSCTVSKNSDGTVPLLLFDMQDANVVVTRDVVDRLRFIRFALFVKLLEQLICDEFETSLRTVSSPLRSGGGVAYTDAAIVNYIGVGNK